MLSDIPFPPTRAAALERLQGFLPNAGRSYAARRNFDLPGHEGVSRLSPYLRHRVITEEEVLRGVLAAHRFSAAEKFIQEVFWRTYWKGWLQMRPGVWTAYQADLRRDLNRVQTESGLRSEWEAACAGQTGIDAFDHWAAELVRTGYMHNHARMWFASIWIFTLRLPWTLGADFFLRHLLDGDPASNTLSWRWVAGLQTKGKTYLARASNIAKYTEGRFQPKGLAPFAAALEGPPHPDRVPAPTGHSLPTGPCLLLLHKDDLSPNWLFEQGAHCVSTAVLTSTEGRSPLHVSEQVLSFTDAVVRDCLGRTAGASGDLGPVTSDPEEIVHWAKGADLQVITPFAPVGPTATALDRIAAQDLEIKRILRPFDARAWPHATAGFFRFKSAIPKLIAAL